MPLAAERALHLATLRNRLDGLASRELVERALVCTAADHRFMLADDAVQNAGPGDDRRQVDLEIHIRTNWRVVKLLRRGENGAYERALAALPEAIRDWWQDLLEDEGDERPEPMAASLQDFLETEVDEWHNRRRAEIATGPLIRQQASGESLDPDRAQKLQTYDMRLDRQIERTIAMLLKLRELCAWTIEGQEAS